jgi:hypothetical protein
MLTAIVPRVGQRARPRGTIGEHSGHSWSRVEHWERFGVRAFRPAAGYVFTADRNRAPYACRAAWRMRAHLVGWGGPCGSIGQHPGGHPGRRCEKTLYARSRGYPSGPARSPFRRGLSRCAVWCALCVQHRAGAREFLIARRRVHR